MSMIVTADTLPRRIFADDADLMALVAEFEACIITKAEWSHFTHLAVAAGTINRDGIQAARRDIPARIRALNDANRVPNTDDRGYHETLTQFFLLLVHRYLATQPRGHSVAAAVNAMPMSPFGDKNIAFRFYSRDLLLSVTARRQWVDPDLRTLAYMASISP